MIEVVAEEDEEEDEKEPTPEPTPEPSAEVVALTKSPAFRRLRKFNVEAEAESSDSGFDSDST